MIMLLSLLSFDDDDDDNDDNDDDDDDDVCIKNTILSYLVIFYLILTAVFKSPLISHCQLFNFNSG